LSHDEFGVGQLLDDRPNFISKRGDCFQAPMPEGSLIAPLLMRMRPHEDRDELTLVLDLTRQLHDRFTTILHPVSDEGLVDQLRIQFDDRLAAFNECL
jgi:hypothetical protein